LYVVVPFSSTFSHTFIEKWRKPLLVEYGFSKEELGRSWMMCFIAGGVGRACAMDGAAREGEERMFTGGNAYFEDAAC
jgi:hypothetical protein